MSFAHIFVPVVEMTLIAGAIYYLLSFFWNTRAMDLLYGILAFLAVFVLSKWLNLPVLEKLMLYVVNVAVLALLIIFQPELRLTLAKLSLKGKKTEQRDDFDKFLDAFIQVIYRFSEKRIGALVLLENNDSLEELAKRAVWINAQFSPELLGSIFVPTSPLHDGAVIIRGTTILSAATILPLAEDSSYLAKSMGTRHRAALGITQITDVLVVVVSEESGKVSVARAGVITRGIKSDRLKGVLSSVFVPQAPEQERRSIFERLSFYYQRLMQWIGIQN